MVDFESIIKRERSSTWIITLAVVFNLFYFSCCISIHSPTQRTFNTELRAVSVVKRRTVSYRLVVSLIRSATSTFQIDRSRIKNSLFIYARLIERWIEVNLKHLTSFEHNNKQIRLNYQAHHSFSVEHLMA